MAEYKNNNKKKHSGCKHVENAKGEFLSAWNYSKGRGMLKAFVFPYHGTGTLNKSQKGNEYISMMCKVTYQNSGIEKLIPVQMNIHTKKVTLSDLGMVLNPKAPNGGYFGKFSKS